MKLTPLTKVIRASIGASLLLTAAMPVMAQNATPELSIAPFVFSMFVIMAILNIVLFFKIWKMTNTVENIFNLSLAKSDYRYLAPEENFNRKIVFVKDE